MAIKRRWTPSYWQHCGLRAAEKWATICSKPGRVFKKKKQKQTFLLALGQPDSGANNVNMAV